MILHQLRMFALVAVTLGGLVTATVFDCENENVYIECLIKLGDDPSDNSNVFIYNGNGAPACSDDNTYCATVEYDSSDENQWLISVVNNGVPCSGVCPVTLTCPSDLDYCFDACVQEAC
jgi:hypothetical protein